VSVIEQWKATARRLKRLIQALSIAARDPRTPVVARVVAGCVLAYALSPIDLIPDPIPVLGYLDDIILIPLGIALAIRLIPDAVWAEVRAEALAHPWQGKPTSRVGALVIGALWIVAVVLTWWLVRAAMT
jgi:uncharacterized membrane protein YkvA (DUF1232 family)